MRTTATLRLSSTLLQSWLPNTPFCSACLSRLRPNSSSSSRPFSSSSSTSTSDDSTSSKPKPNSKPQPRQKTIKAPALEKETTPSRPRKRAPYTRRPPVLPTSLQNHELFKAVSAMATVRSRPTLINLDSARDVVRAWGVDKMHDVVVVEPFAGPGGLTRAFLELPNVKRVIAFEDSFRYLPILNDLCARQDDPERLYVHAGDGFSWDSYAKIEELGLLKDVVHRPWKEPQDGLFLALQQSTNRHGEQLFMQCVSAAATKMWLWKYGRFSIGAITADAYWKVSTQERDRVPHPEADPARLISLLFQKIFAPIGSHDRHKVGVILSTVASLTPTALTQPWTPTEHHFHKPRSDQNTYSPIKVTPWIEPMAQDFEVLQFVMKQMFISKSTGWERTMPGLAVGAGNLIPTILARGGPPLGKQVQALDVDEWVVIADAFAEWPFRPTELYDNEFIPEY
ncbi:BZ3500_MvSof-1268-A1-R1_Chr11-1g03145 [Microbotryum saponariae]|uniref:Mitochondrial transcription factor 1 n=1 Tax=Microbotryum saponariae TaxID=289078 RepID=A0A2X0M3P2_9BASI|nr:BZ3501_MvSof-1269-A2-R1_Chr11g02720 [Microbotryum saponariae]SDA03705.1 BZ3500_MvSof-1268-A1-R1_Chr11-1g03145 [Microbotryum saponariae]